MHVLKISFCEFVTLSLLYVIIPACFVVLLIPNPAHLTNLLCLACYRAVHRGQQLFRISILFMSASKRHTETVLHIFRLLRYLDIFFVLHRLHERIMVSVRRTVHVRVYTKFSILIAVGVTFYYRFTLYAALLGDVRKQVHG